MKKEKTRSGETLNRARLAKIDSLFMELSDLLREAVTEYEQIEPPKGATIDVIKDYGRAEGELSNSLFYLRKSDRNFAYYAGHLKKLKLIPGAKR